MTSVLELLEQQAAAQRNLSATIARDVHQMKPVLADADRELNEAEAAYRAAVARRAGIAAQLAAREAEADQATTVAAAMSELAAQERERTAPTAPDVAVAGAMATGTPPPPESRVRPPWHVEPAPSGQHRAGRDVDTTRPEPVGEVRTDG